jgi:hypothetical protein
MIAASAQTAKHYDAIYSGVPLLDDGGRAVSAHGACILKENGKYYLFGERHSDTSNAFAGFNCYSSADLYNWKFEKIALPVQPSGRLGPNRVGERVKVMKSPKTGEFVMFMHTDTLGYTDPVIGYATSKSVTGPYVFRGAILFNGSPIKRWDMGSFQDDDGKGYLLIHEGDIYRLSDEYTRIEEQVLANMSSGCESPAVFKKGSTYYWLSSHKTSWERNDNEYYTASSLKGPWKAGGNFAPAGTLTWNSQTTFVLPVIGASDTTFMFMGDRWSYPKQESAATYVWQPLVVNGSVLSIPAFQEAWTIDLKTGKPASSVVPGKEIPASDANRVGYTGAWRPVSSLPEQRSSDEEGARCTVAFTGSRIAWYGQSTADGGYARVTIQKNGRLVLSSLVDMYCKNPNTSLRFISPVLPKDSYTLAIEVAGEHGNWSDKRKSMYGSTGNRVSVERFVVSDK